MTFRRFGILLAISYVVLTIIYCFTSLLFLGNELKLLSIITTAIFTLPLIISTIIYITVAVKRCFKFPRRRVVPYLLLFPLICFFGLMIYSNSTPRRITPGNVVDNMFDEYWTFAPQTAYGSPGPFLRFYDDTIPDPTHQEIQGSLFDVNTLLTNLTSWLFLAFILVSFLYVTQWPKIPKDVVKKSILLWICIFAFFGCETISVTSYNNTCDTMENEKNQLYWKAENVPAALQPMLTELGAFYPVSQDTSHGIELVCVHDGDISGSEIVLKDSIATIRYSRQADAARAIGALLSGLVTESSPYRETTQFQTLGIMLDCSRNAVMKVDHIEKWLRQLTLLGYNMVMLYTEDTYELPDEPYFGYQRGAYSQSEIRQIDAYAARLGIEIVPCIQTLGHLEKILRYHAYAKVRDTYSVLLVGEEETYALIEKMIAFWKDACRTDRIHVGMDETHDLGRGRYLDMHGYRNGFDLFNEHLSNVVELCRAKELKPMIWSDMYFRLGNKNQSYYDASTVIPDEVVQQIPQDVELVYWDYYHKDTAFYTDWIARHRTLGKEPVMASGIWTWNKYWYDHRTTEASAGACIEACRECNLKELFFTMWGDNGAYCDHDSAFAGMVFCAEKAYGNTQPEKDILEKRFKAVCGGSYAAHIVASDINGDADLLAPNMWDDPIYETHFRTWAKDDYKKMKQVAERFADIADELEAHTDDTAAGNCAYAYATACAFAERYSVSAELLRAYRTNDCKGIQQVKARIPDVVEAIRVMEQEFREMWMSHNKPEGIETIQARFGMLYARYTELEIRLDEYLNVGIEEIVELDYACPPGE